MNKTGRFTAILRDGHGRVIESYEGPNIVLNTRGFHYFLPMVSPTVPANHVVTSSKIDLDCWSEEHWDLLSPSIHGLRKLIILRGR